MGVDFEWYDEYSIGVEEIDDQHKRFLKLIKATYELEDKTSEHEEARKLLDELMTYALFHFNSEELLMKKYLYPHYMDQKKQHGELIKELELNVEEVKAGKGDMINLLCFLMNWFVDHDHYYDKKFGEYVNKIKTIK